MEEEYSIASEIKSETKIFGKIDASIFIFLCLYFLLFYTLRELVHPQLMLSYTIFVIGSGIYLTIPSFFNKKRKNYQSIWICLKKDNNVYQALPNISVEKKKETLKAMIERDYYGKE